ncbi:MAG: pirin family protein [Pirellulales bacterium]|nr:pirin family protein [Pirellulales bacterium]
MLAVRKADERGGGDYGWLNTRHTFSFAEYADPRHMGFRALRVINEDRIAALQGFGMHPHRDMEIVTYVLSGELEHRDSLGHQGILRAGEVQRMTAGTGISHSERNPSATNPVHLYQIWLLPDRRGYEPSYEQRSFPASGRLGRWQTVVSPDGRDDSLVVQQDVSIYLAELAREGTLSYDFPPGRYGWLQVLAGTARIGVDTLTAGDGLASSDETRLMLEAQDFTELMLFDLP